MDVQVSKSVISEGSPKVANPPESSPSRGRPNERYDADFIKSVKNRATGYGIHPNWYLALLISAEEAGVSEAHLDSMIRSMI